VIASKQIQRLKRPQVLCRGDDETRDRRAETEAEVLCHAPERERGSTLLWRYHGDEQRLVRDADHADAGTADDRASERLPRPVDERKAGIAERARKIAGDQDRLGAKVVEQGSRGRCYEGARAQDRGKHQTGGGRREAAELVQVDDLEREDQPIAEPAERIPGLQEQYREAGPSAKLSLEIGESLCSGSYVRAVGELVAGDLAPFRSV
jgi:hypothetical protein